MFICGTDGEVRVVAWNRSQVVDRRRRQAIERCMQGAALHGRVAFARAYHWLPEAMKRDCLPSPRRISI